MFADDFLYLILKYKLSEEASSLQWRGRQIRFRQAHYILEANSPL
jgi:hypothetical protein